MGTSDDRTNHIPIPVIQADDTLKWSMGKYITVKPNHTLSLKYISNSNKNEIFWAVFPFVCLPQRYIGRRAVRVRRFLNAPLDIWTRKSRMRRTNPAIIYSISKFLELRMVI